MFAESEPGETYKRVLQADDIEGLKFSHLMATPELDGCIAPVVVTRPEDDGCARAARRGPCCVSASRAAVDIPTPLAGTDSDDARPGCGDDGRGQAGTQYVTESGVPIFWPEDTMPTRSTRTYPRSSTQTQWRAPSLRLQRLEGLECQPLTLDFASWEGCVGNNSEDGVNCIRWRNRQEVWSWAHHLVAVTLVHYREDTGVIVDADMEINAFNTSWSTSLECEPDLHDLIATITHEVGHFVGLDHVRTSSRP